ncbi:MULTISPECIES: PIG-L family deacetylase [Bizionia]|uniref:PIG-L family deacetylase n=1 Tax=Bizionia algoritergicola TaxID=291187 RepID=A0A5D0QVY3_9FLAO|nr:MULTISPECIES: PIG-L family deacetylase [Bizionia]OBX21288.1 LmbE family protein [Bizionia sp. APA-3]TYB73282.1 PIG-L family deacetylase [Bizionia algoritergicola]
MTKQLRILFLLALSITFSYAQQPKKPNSSEIYESIKKLNFLGSVLYVAAHPDDENTRLISYMANNVKARTAYLSLTRGDGGQNLIGPEIRELLGVIRTQELLTARSIDGGEQLFTRANDFGYSKHPDETLAIWNKEAVLSDVVLAIRQFQPDIIINRFDHRSPGSTHGHHTSSAMLSLEAFDLVGDASVYPNQLDTTTIWQPQRIFFNTSWWFYGSQEKFDKADKSKLIGLDTGIYFPSSGLSNPEIAALSRSQHKSQGFGNTGTRGSEMEYIELIKGTMPTNQTNLFEGIDTSWNRVKGGAKIGTILKDVEANYDFKNPSASLPKLVEAYTGIQNLENKHWKTIKTKEIKAIIAACAGLFVEAVAETNQATSGESIQLNLETINRSSAKMTLVSFTNPDGLEVQKGIALNENESIKIQEIFHIPNTDNAPVTTPYWLIEKGSLGMYKVSDESLIGKPESPDYFNVTFNVNIAGTSIPFTKPVIYKTNDPVKGEVYKPFEIIPEASARIAEKVIIFETENTKDIPVSVKAGHDNLEGTVRLSVPKGWSVSPENHDINIINKGEEQTVLFSVTPPINQSEGSIKPIITVNGNTYSNELIEIDYDHIPYQTVLLPSESKVVRLDLKKKGENIAYIAGAGDVVPESLQQIGYTVTTIEPEAITSENLSRFDAVVIGIRAYNTVETLKFKQSVLFDFVKNGGNMVVQYNTSRGLVTDELAPYTLELSRDRVTDEFAEVKFLAPNHPVLNIPNKITQTDFENWTQERGLYFPDTWSKDFTPILSMHDKGESAKKGSLLVAQYGKGYYIYTGLSFFREFPAGVSGAYRLFANILSLGK